MFVSLERASNGIREKLLEDISLKAESDFLGRNIMTLIFILKYSY